MTLSATVVLYLTIGVGVGVALFANDRNASGKRAGFVAISAVLFWPLYVPILLSAAPRQPKDAEPVAAEPDAMSAAIAQVEHELATAFASLDGWAEHILDDERDRLGELSAALEHQAARVREMDALIERSGPLADAAPLDDPALAAGDETASRFRQSQQARAHNLARLAEVRQSTYLDLMATLAWIGELVSMIHLAKFTGAPAARAEELVAQIAAAVEGFSAAAWREETVLH